MSTEKYRSHRVAKRPLREHSGPDGFTVTGQEPTVAKNFKSDIELGVNYEDVHTGFSGTAVAICFFLHACERVTLRTLEKDSGKVIECSFDAPELRNVKTQMIASSSRPGGPERVGAARGGSLSR